MVDILDPEKEFIGITPKKTILDFWKWGCSDLLQNITRGIIAEYIVLCALGIEPFKSRNPWEDCDIKTSNNLKIEIKTTGYLQCWYIKEKPKIINPKVVIKPTKLYHIDSGKMEYEKTLNADLYIICFHKEENWKNVDPMNINQWSFWILNKKEIAKLLNKKKTLSLSIFMLRKKYKELNYEDLEKYFEKKEDLR